MNREKEIFEQALDLASAQERVAFIKGACRGDAAMQKRLMGLLRASEGAEDFLPEAPQGGETIKLNPPENGEEALGSRIGHYKLLQKVGEGGCGAVYMANRSNRCAGVLLSRSSSLGWIPKASSPGSMQNARPWR